MERSNKIGSADDPPPAEALVGARIVHTEAPLAARDIRDTVLVKEGDLFLLTDTQGNVPAGNRDGLGLWQGDTRYLSGFELVVQGLRPTVLLSGERGAFLSEQVLTNPNLTSADGRLIEEQTIEIRRYRRLVGSGFRESLSFDNFNAFAVVLDVSFLCGADFLDMFEVRGLVTPEPREVAVATDAAGTVHFRYAGKDGVMRETRLALEPPPLRVAGSALLYVLTLPPRGSRRLNVSAEVVPGARGGSVST